MKSAHSKSALPKPALSKKLLRSLPTLTEVVPPPAPSAAPVALVPATAIDEDALVERVLQRLELSLEAQIRKAVAAALEEQMKELGPRIRQRVDYAVRKAVTQAVTAELTPPPASRTA